MKVAKSVQTILLTAVLVAATMIAQAADTTKPANPTVGRDSMAPPKAPPASTTANTRGNAPLSTGDSTQRRGGGTLQIAPTTGTEGPRLGL